MTALLRLKVTPNAPVNAVLGEADGVIRLKLRAPAVDGKANAALVAFLAEALRVPKAAVNLQGGLRSRLERVEVQGHRSASRVAPDRVGHVAGHWIQPAEHVRRLCRHLQRSYSGDRSAIPEGRKAVAGRVGLISLPRIAGDFTIRHDNGHADRSSVGWQRQA